MTIKNGECRHGIFLLSIKIQPEAIYASGAILHEHRCFGHSSDLLRKDIRSTTNFTSSNRLRLALFSFFYLLSHLFSAKLAATTINGHLYVFTVFIADVEVESI